MRNSTTLRPEDNKDTGGSFEKGLRGRLTPGAPILAVYRLHTDVRARPERAALPLSGYAVNRKTTNTQSRARVPLGRLPGCGLLLGGPSEPAQSWRHLPGFRRHAEPQADRPVHPVRQKESPAGSVLQSLRVVDQRHPVVWFTGLGPPLLARLVLRGHVPRHRWRFRGARFDSPPASPLPSGTGKGSKFPRRIYRPGRCESKAASRCHKPFTGSSRTANEFSKVHQERPAVEGDVVNTTKRGA